MSVSVSWGFGYSLAGRPVFLAQGFSTIQRRQYVWGEDEEDEEDEEGLGEICTVNQGNYRLIGYRLIDKS